MGRWSSFGSLFGGLLLLSTSGPFFVASGMDAITVGFSRMALAGGLLLLMSLYRLEASAAWRMVRREGRSLSLGGFIFAVHLLLWMKAFEYTSFASTVLLLVAQPALAVVVGHYFGEEVKPAMGVSLAIAGIALVLVAAGDLAMGRNAWIGDGMCILAAFCTTLFVPTTRRARATLPMSLFLGIIFGVAALLFAPLALLSSSSVADYGWESWRWVAAIVLISTVGGHGLTNLAARHVSLFRLNVVILLQPLLAIAIGFVLFGLRATSWQIVGGMLLIVAVFVGLWGTRGQALSPAAP